MTWICDSLFKFKDDITILETSPKACQSISLQMLQAITPPPELNQIIDNQLFRLFFIEKRD
jgi:hypothetical protein